MTPIEKKKYADFIRELIELRKKEPYFNDVREEAYRLAMLADSIYPIDKNPYSEMQWSALQSRFSRDISPEELEDGLGKMKARNQRSEARGRRSEKVEIAY